MLTACYLQNTIPGSLQAGETQLSPSLREWHHFQRFEKEVACPGPPFLPLFQCPGHLNRADVDRGKLLYIHPEFPGLVSTAPSSHRGAALHLLPGEWSRVVAAAVAAPSRTGGDGFAAASEGKQRLGKEQLCSQSEQAKSVGAMHTKLLNLELG